MDNMSALNVNKLVEAESASVGAMIRARDDHARTLRAVVALHEALAAAEVAAAEAEQVFRLAQDDYSQLYSLRVRAERIPGSCPGNPIVIE